MRNDGPFGLAGGPTGVKDNQAVFGFRRNGQRMTVLFLQYMLVLRADLDDLAVPYGRKFEISGQIFFNNQELR